MQNTVLKFTGDEDYLQFDDDKYHEYLEEIDDDDEIFYCYYWVVRFSHVPDILRNKPEEHQNIYLEAGRRTLRKYAAIYAFYDKHGLSKVSLSNDAGEIIKDPVYESDLTEEGMQFVDIAKHWRETKGASKNPPDTKYLERKLKAMREQ